MSDEFDGRVVVVTGAAGNLGSAVVELFASRGARIAAVDHSKATAGTGNERRFDVTADLRDAASTAAAFDAILARYGRIDALCNIAGGFAAGTPVHETPDDLWRRMFDLNAMSVVNTAKATVPAMIAAGSGVIVNVSAASSLHGQANTAAYAVAKNAVVRPTERMAAELRAGGILVTCVLPTIIDTPQNRAAMPGADFSKWTRPSEIARKLLVLVGTPDWSNSGRAIEV